MNLLPACPSDPPATILFLAGRFVLQQGGEQTARPDETSFNLTFLKAKTAAAAVLALPHVAPPDATTSQGSRLGPEGI